MGKNSVAHKGSQDNSIGGKFNIRSGLGDLEYYKNKDKYYDDLDLSNEDNDDESSDEEEDEYGELVTEDIEEGINKVLETIEKHPEKLLDKNTKFFDNIDTSDTKSKPKAKALYLDEYQRLKLIADAKGGFKDEEEEEKPYAIQQKEDKEKILAEINKEIEKDGSEEDEEDGFFKKRENQKTIESLELPDPEEDPNKFLEAYIEKKAWVPRTVDLKTGELVIPTYNELVDDDEEYDDNAETLETAYNFRFEDPNAKEIISYARSQNTIRRANESSRKRKRDAKKAALKAEEEKQEAELNKLKKSKTTEIASKLAKLKEEIEQDPDAEKLKKIFDDEYLDGDFEGDEWDRRMAKIFNEEFYNEAPTENIEEDYENEAYEGNGDDDEDMEAYNENDENEDEGQEQEQEESGLSKNKLKKLEKQKQREEKKKLLEAAERVVDENIDLLIKEKGSSRLKKKLEQPKFKYREVSPDSYGLTPRDILLADDKDLNRYVGIKKLATYIDPEKKKRDHRRFAKSKRLKEWRMSVFNTKDVPDDEKVKEIWTNKFKDISNAASSSKKHKKRKTNK